MYVVAPPMDGLPWLNNNDGWLGYIIRYGILVVVCVTACYARPIFTAIKSKIASKKGN